MCYLLTLMTPFPYINISKSIKTNWLAFENKWYRLEDIGTFVLAPLFILVIIVILYLKALNFSNQNDRAFGYFILPFIGLLCIYFIYRKITETKLFKLSTNLSKERNKELLKIFLQEQDFSLFHEIDGLIVGVAEESMSFNYSKLQLYIFVLSEDCIRFTMLKIYSKGNPPVFIDHLFLKRDLSRFFSNKYQ